MICNANIHLVIPSKSRGIEENDNNYISLAEIVGARAAEFSYNAIFKNSHKLLDR